jgi:hypothetical protein
MKPAASLLDRAIRMAVSAHSGQTYPSPEPEPYILHPLRVMASVDGERDQIAAVLHDVVEDCDVTLDQLEREGFPPQVIRTLDCLTCDPHSPWQRGSNENTNGLLRQYLPKRSNLSAVSPGELRRIQRSLNTRPRQTLAYRTPHEKMSEVVALTA